MFPRTLSTELRRFIAGSGKCFPGRMFPSRIASYSYDLLVSCIGGGRSSILGGLSVTIVITLHRVPSRGVCGHRMDFKPHWIGSDTFFEVLG